MTGAGGRLDLGVLIDELAAEDDSVYLGGDLGAVEGGPADFAVGVFAADSGGGHVNFNVRVLLEGQVENAAGIVMHELDQTGEGETVLGDGGEH